MPGYISEFDYFGTSDEEFVEIAVPAGTDVSSYSLVFYQWNGTIYNMVSLGSYTGTFAGQDVYVVDQTTPGFDSGGDSMGTFYADDAIALVDDTGTVLQYISWEGNTVTAIEGVASGTTSTDTGFAGESLQSDDGGSSYFTQPTSNKGSIPACYAQGTLVETPTGLRLVEDLRIDDEILTADKSVRKIRWIWDRTSPIDPSEDGGLPVLIQCGAFALGRPDRDLIVSPQHRILVGADRQLDDLFKSEFFVPAKSLVQLPGIRFMRGKRSIRWIHFSCDQHEVIRANGCLSETLYLGPMILRSLPRSVQSKLKLDHRNGSQDDAINGPMARPCLSLGQVEYTLSRGEVFEAEPNIDFQHSPAIKPDCGYMSEYL